jgi:hypothetical protein
MNLYQKPPRSLPFIQQLCIIFGGVIQIMGWGFFSIGCLFMGIFGFLSAPIVSPSTDKWEIVQAVVKETEATSSSENKRRIYKITSTYMYKGLTYQNISYNVGRSLSIGQSISVKVNPANPYQSEAQGLRTRPFSGSTILFLLPFPLVGLVMILSIARKNIKARNLLLFGELTRGMLKEKRATNSSITINNVRYPIYHYIFEFEYMGKKHEAQGKTHKGWLVEDEAQEKILFNPVNPSESVIYDAVPVMPKIDTQGNMTLTPKYYGNLILPSIGILIFVFLVIPVLMRQLGLS